MDRKTWSRLLPAGAALAALGVSLPAAAHEGDHEHMAFADALHHLLSEPDHQLAAAGLVVVIVAGTWTWMRRRAAK